MYFSDIYAMAKLIDAPMAFEFGFFLSAQIFLKF